LQNHWISLHCDYKYTNFYTGLLYSVHQKTMIQDKNKKETCIKESISQSSLLLKGQQQREKRAPGKVWSNISLVIFGVGRNKDMVIMWDASNLFSAIKYSTWKYICIASLNYLSKLNKLTAFRFSRMPNFCFMPCFKKLCCSKVYQNFLTYSVDEQWKISILIIL